MARLPGSSRSVYVHDAVWNDARRRAHERGLSVSRMIEELLAAEVGQA